MTPAPNAAKEAARTRMAQTGESYTTALRHMRQAAAAGDPRSAATMRDAVAAALAARGWPPLTCTGEDGKHIAYAGPCETMRLVVDRTGVDYDDDPDDPAVSQAAVAAGEGRLYITGLAPSLHATTDDLDLGRLADTDPNTLAEYIDDQVAAARARVGARAAAEADTACPICGDRYPGRHLLANSPDEHAQAVCPACVFDGDQPFRTHVPYLANRLDELERNDLAAPAGWAAVAAVLALASPPRLGARVTRWLTDHGMDRLWAMADDRWDDPLDNTWIWLPPKQDRHPALASLGAGASLRAVAAAIDAGIPDLQTRAKRACRDGEVRWRPAVWPALIAYAVTFTTQAFERPTHRKPVHVVESTDDGLSMLMPSGFAVRGAADNLAGLMSTVLDQVLFPALFGHGLYDEPDEPARRYGATEADDRAPATPQQAAVRYATDRAAAIALALGYGLGSADPGGRLWDHLPAPDPAAHDIPGQETSAPAGAAPGGVTDDEGGGHDRPGSGALGPTASATHDVADIRKSLLEQLAIVLYDAAGGSALTAARGWQAHGVWVVPEDAAAAVAQAQRFLSAGVCVQAIWAGPSARLPEPVSICVEITQVFAHSTGPSDVPWLRVWDGRTLFGLTFADLVAVMLAGPEDEFTPCSEASPPPRTNH